MPLKCDKCKTKITDKEYLNCSGCQRNLHLDCASVSEKLFRLMKKESRANWKCRDCHAKSRPSPNDYVTLRKHRANPTQESSPSTSISVMGDTLSSPTGETLNRSCPEKCTSLIENIKEELEQEKEKNLHLESKLESADAEIERLMTENYSLNEIIAKRDAKINQLLHICRSTNDYSNCDTPRTPIQKPSNFSTPKTLSSFNKKHHHKEAYSSTCMQRTADLVSSPPNTATQPAGYNAKQREMEIDSTSPSASERSPTATSADKLQKPPIPTEVSSTDKKRNRICLLSTNKRALNVAQTYYDESHDLCHYLLPNRGLLQLLEGIESKTAGFSRKDFVILLIGEEDFKHTNNYQNLILCARELVLKVTHTNVVIGLPTFRHSNTSTDLFNSRLETFNNLLCLDITTHEHAYLVDTNLNLQYDHTMFHRISGSLNKNGLKRVFQDIKEATTKIAGWFQEYEMQLQQIGSTGSTDGNNVEKSFFRGPTGQYN